ncbi:hypothetical protein EDD86DRAFT_211451 [Gorgonomyces haynaldii]|nr:hypothetical protein EDD86DRAFT_211451 [Gorgonomyces haynaldii]
MFNRRIIVGFVFFMTVECAPRFNGVPVGCPFLIHEAKPVLEKEFPGLEIAVVFQNGMKGHTYDEQGGLFGFYPSECTVGVPVYEKLDALEEARLGANGIKKKPVGHLELKGTCKYGCAVVHLVGLRLYRSKDEEPDYTRLIWEWHK